MRSAGRCFAPTTVRQSPECCPLALEYGGRLSFQDSMTEKASKHYDAAYFEYQARLGDFNTWASLGKFNSYISADDTVLDFGCGGGFVLKSIQCKKKVGVEVNPAALETARRNAVEVYTDADQVADDSVDVLISNHALEHTLNPLQELKTLLHKVRKGGKVVFFVPCDSIRVKYKPNDVNHHLYTWNPMCLGNLFTEAGYLVKESKAYTHRWPPRIAQIVAKIGGRPLFELACRITGSLTRKYFQVRLIAERPD